MTNTQKLDLILVDLSELKEKMNIVTEEVSEQGKKLSEYGKKLDAVTEKLSEHEKKLSEHEKKLDAMTEELEEFKVKLDSVEEQTKKTNFIIENELRVNIQRIAEGHLDLSRNLHEAMRPNNEVEMLAVQVKVLDSRVSGLESKLEKFA